MTDARSGGGPWRNRTILVTGGTSGIGRQFAIHFAAEGAKVIACGRNDMALRKLQTEHPTIEAIQCDITARPNVLTLVETIRDRYERHYLRGERPLWARYGRSADSGGTPAAPREDRAGLPGCRRGKA